MSPTSRESSLSHTWPIPPRLPYRLHDSSRATWGLDSVPFSVMAAPWGRMRCLREAASQKFAPFMLCPVTMDFNEKRCQKRKKCLCKPSGSGILACKQPWEATVLVISTKGLPLQRCSGQALSAAEWAGIQAFSHVSWTPACAGVSKYCLSISRSSKI